jgi:hypothetical protein
VTFDLVEMGYAQLMIDNGWNDAIVDQWEIETLGGLDYVQMNETEFKGIDVYRYNDIIPLLKCEEPCFTCLDTNPKYCLSCWGRETDIGEGTFSKFFL